MKRIAVSDFDNINGRPVMVFMEFEMSDDGNLRHFIEGNLRATVPPEGIEAYCETWPDAGKVCAKISAGVAPEKEI